MSSACSNSCRSRRAAGRGRRCWLLAVSASLSLVGSRTAHATERLTLDLPAGELDRAVATIARQARVSIGFEGALPAVRTPGLRGAFTVDEALARLLAGSNLVAVRIDGGAFRIERRTLAPQPPRPPAPLQELIVVGTKRRETLSSVPFSVTVLQPEREPGLQGRSPTTADVVALAGDVQLTNLGPGRNRLFIRGVADSAFGGPTQSTVSIYLDDGRISFDTPDPDLRLVDVDRIEVLKGPQGSLYGTGALGGIFRIVPNRPETGVWSGRLAIEGSAHADGGPGGAVEGVLNIPLREGAAMRVVGYGITEGGWIDDLQRRRDDVNRVNIAGGRVAVTAQLSERWTVDLAATAQSIQARDAQYAVAASGARTRRSELAQPSDNDFGNVRVAVSAGLGDLELRSTTSFVLHDIDNRYDATGAAGLGLSGSPLAYRESQSLRMATHETRLSDPSRQRPWVAGVALISSQSAFRGAAFAGPDSAPVYRLRRDFREAAIFGEASRMLTPRVQATLGARLALAQSEDETSGADREEAHSLSLTPMAAVSWRAAEGLQVYGRFATASRPGGLNPLGAPVRFESDELQSFELGARYRDPDGMFSVVIDAFHIHWTDIQSDLLQPNGLIATSNVGVANNLGAEASLTVKWPEGWTIETGAVVQEAELRPKSQMAPAKRESGLPAIPELSGRLGVFRDLPIGKIDASFGAQARYVGQSRLSFDPALNRSMGAYAVVDLTASAAWGPWRLDLAVSNAFDRDADTFSFGNPFSVRSEDQRASLPPQRWRARLERRF